MRHILRTASFSAGLLFASTAFAQCNIPYQLTNGQVADATQVMGDVNALANCIEDAAPAGSQNAVQLNAGNGTFAGIGPLANGQLVIGSTGNVPQPATLTAGPGVTITNSPGSITLSSSGAPGGMPGAIQFNSDGTFGGVLLTDGMIVVGSGATFSSTAKAANVQLSNSNLTATSANASYAAVLASNSQSSGKYYFEFQNVTITDGNSGVGVATATVDFNNYLGKNLQGIAVEPNGQVWFNGAQIGTAAAVPTGSTVGIAVDITNRLIWFRTGSGNWNNSASANPVTGVGGFSISTFSSTTIFPAVIWRENQGTAKIAMTASSWATIPPTGFSPWAQESTPTAVKISGAASLSNSGVLTSNASAAQAAPANPAGTTSIGAQVMQGLAGSITPGASGRVLFMASGDAFNTNAVGQGFVVQLRYGTGTAPGNGTNAVGITIGGAVKGVTAIVSSPQQIPFALQSMVPNLTPGTPYWFDLGLSAIGGGTATLENISLTAVEM
ncbi:SPRY domain-containing protein [Rhizobium leguminosarum]|uniref:SPRY domain-containing protein n=1 Tax=Rhizobium leguminosarum TaxID=384 RepID=UPI003F97A31E